MGDTAQKPHPFLERLIGEWTYEFEASGGPGEPLVTHSGMESVRALGGVWVLCEGRGAVPGDDAGATLMTLGYDASTRRVRGTYVGSMMSYLWIYDGEVSPDGSRVTLDSQGPSYTADGPMAKYRDVIEFRSDDHRVLTSRFQDESGAWNQVMAAHYRRVK